MWGLYYGAIYMYVLLVRLSAIKSPKARLWLKGRENQFEKIKLALPQNPKRIWMHCASLGEFEQGRPILEKLRTDYPEYALIVSFFSPSGYEIRKNYKGADSVIYLPEDLPGNAKKFLDELNPSLAIFVKYEFWAGYLNELKKREIPAILISARFRKKQFLFSPFGGWVRNKLKAFDTIHVQDVLSNELLANAGFQNLKISGDTRYDRVYANAQTPEAIYQITDWLKDRRVLVAGSTWADDEAVILPWNFNNLALIIAPHEIDEAHIKSIEDRCGAKSLRYTKLKNHQQEDSDVLILDTIGILMSVYKAGNIAYVGGAFHKLLHNILEPAAMGLPVIFGPFTEKFPEAEALMNAGGGFKIHSRLEFEQALRVVEQNDSSGRQSLEFVCSQTGATTIIMEDIRKLLKEK